MIPRYAYTAMLVTGGLHCALGVFGFITACVGMAKLPYFRTYCAVASVVSTWTILVGCVGISAGMRHFTHAKTRQLKIAYMVTAILSACFFCLIGSWMYSFTGKPNAWFTPDFYNYNTYLPLYANKIRYAGGIGISLEFILAIVSSSICCCCSPTNQNPTVVVQAPFQQIFSSVPITTTVPYQTLQNSGVVAQPPPYQSSFDPIKTV